MTRPELKTWVEERGLEPYRGDQIFQWIQSPDIETFDQMTNLAKKWRTRLDEEAFLSRLTSREIETSRDGTRKFLWDLEDGERIESVLIPERGHYTLCISSQVGLRSGVPFLSYRPDRPAPEFERGGNRQPGAHGKKPSGGRPHSVD